MRLRERGACRRRCVEWRQSLRPAIYLRPQFRLSSYLSLSLSVFPKLVWKVRSDEAMNVMKVEERKRTNPIEKNKKQER